MVVVSGSWMKNVTCYSSPNVNNNDVMETNNSNGGDMAETAAKAILICSLNSHPFQERHLSLDQPVKIGRSVARAKPMPTNAIFDCKVLSRHHALLWYEDGKFFLQDTKSSNGTFVNNNRLPPEKESHQLFSGDVVQFGVDVVENNKKVTHGCIIATIKLFHPDGKECKVFNMQGLVPLDELYHLNQIIQEANQREQCLEHKLAALRHLVEETRKSAEDSWKAYVGEERLLSRVSALEERLRRQQQSGRQVAQDGDGDNTVVKEELAKLQENNETYQVAAKELLEKLHAEKLEAVAVAVQQEREKIAAEQEAHMAKEQLAQLQQEVESLARKVTQLQSQCDKQRTKFEKREQELESKLESESEKLVDLQWKLHQLNALSIQDFQNLATIEQTEGGKLIYKADGKCKEDILAENEVSESVMNKSNGIDNHISLVVGMSEQIENDADSDDDVKTEIGFKTENTKRVSIKLPEEENTEEEKSDQCEDTLNSNKEEEEDDEQQVDSKTLKCQFQSIQNELKKRIEVLESILETKETKMSEVERALKQEQDVSKRLLEETENLKVELEQQRKTSWNEQQQYKDKIGQLAGELEEIQKKSVKEVSYEQLMGVEEELVVMKERFAQVNEEKLKLQRDLLTITEQYNLLCNRSYNRYFLYVAPLVFMVLYLLISAMVS